MAKKFKVNNITCLTGEDALYAEGIFKIVGLSMETYNAYIVVEGRPRLLHPYENIPIFGGEQFLVERKMYAGG